MQKQCVQCKKSYRTRDSRQKNCSKACADVSRAQWKAQTQEQSTIALYDDQVMFVPVTDISKHLPPPEELPAPYAKRVYDMWSGLIGEEDVRTRIA